jgi:hypothetical protein
MPSHLNKSHAILLTKHKYKCGTMMQVVRHWLLTVEAQIFLHVIWFSHIPATIHVIHLSLMPHNLSNLKHWTQKHRAKMIKWNWCLKSFVLSLSLSLALFLFLLPFHLMTSLSYTALNDQNEESGNMLKKAVTA